MYHLKKALAIVFLAVVLLPVTKVQSQQPESGCHIPRFMRVTGISNHSVSVAWTPQSGDNAWLVYRNDSLLGQISTTSFVFYGLASDRDNVIGVCTLCGAGDTSEMATLLIHTPCESMSISDLPFFEDFEYPPYDSAAKISSCWIRLNYYGTEEINPRLTNQISHGGSQSLRFIAGPYYQPVYAVMRGVEQLGGLHLSFWWQQEDFADTRLTVGVMTSPVDTSTFVPLQVLAGTARRWQRCVVDLSQYTGSGKHIAFRVDGIGAAGGRVYIDDVTLSTTAPCDAPSTLTATRITSGVALLRWRGVTGAQYAVDYSSGGGWTRVYTSADTLLLTGLIPNTQYTARVSTVCDTVESSSVSTVFRTRCTSIAASSLPYIDNIEGYAVYDSITREFNSCWLCYRAHNGRPYMPSAPYVCGDHSRSGSKAICLEGGNYLTTASHIVFPYVEAPVNSLAFRCYVRSAGPRLNKAVFTVGLMSDPYDPSTFIPIKTVKGIDSTYREVVVAFDGYSGDYCIAVRYYNLNITAAYIDDISIEPRPAILPVDEVEATAVDKTSATLRWNGVTGADSYRVVYCAGGLCDSINVVSDSSVTITGLLSATEYTVTVYAIGGGNISEGHTMTFVTRCADISTSALPMTFDFETATSLAPCWKAIYFEDLEWVGNYSDNLPRLTDNQAYNSTQSLRITSEYITNYFFGVDVSCNGVVFLPTFERSVDGLTMRFRYKASNNLYRYTRLAVGVSEGTDDTSTFTRLITIAPPDGEWNEYEVPLAEYHGNGRNITIMQYSVYRYGGIIHGYIDDIVIDSHIVCNRPYFVRASNITSNGATIHWTGSAAETYCVRWSIDDSAYVTGATSYTITGLLPGTEYAVGVSRLCNGAYTNYQVTVFYTACSPVMHYSLPWMEDFESYNNGDATIPCWITSNSNSFVVRYNNGNKYLETEGSNEIGVCVLPPFEDAPEDLVMSFDAISNYLIRLVEVGVIEDANDVSTFHSVDTVSIGHGSVERYEITFEGWQQGRLAFRNIGITGNNVYIDNIEVRALAGCAPPSGLVVDNIGTNSADITVSSALGQNNYMLYWNSLTTSDSLSMNGNTYTLTGLDTGTTYEVRVCALCNGSRTTYKRATFTTVCTDVSALPWNEDFESQTEHYTVFTQSIEGTFLNCWTRSRVSPYYNSFVRDADFYIRANNGYLSMASQNNSSAVLWSVVTLPHFAYAIDSLTLRFSYRFDAIGDMLEIGVVGNTGAFVPIDTIYSENTHWEDYESPLARAVGLSGDIALRYTDITTGTSHTIYIDNVSVNRTSSCRTPQNARIVAGETSAAVTIFDPSGVGSYRVVWSDGTVADSAIWNTSSGTITGLTPGTSYNISINSLCSDSVNIDAFTTEFQTICAVIRHSDLPYNMTFDLYGTNQPFNEPCWKVYNGDPQGIFPLASGYVHHGLEGKSLNLSYNSAGEKMWIVCPVIDSLEDLELTFWAYGTTASHITVGTMTHNDDVTTFIPYVMLQPDTNSVWQEYIVPLAGGNAEAHYIAIMSSSTTDYNPTYIDDITINIVTSCPRPQSITVEDITTTTATLTVTDTYDNGYYRVTLSAQNGVDTTFEIGNSSIQLYDLMPATTYSVKVSSICDDSTITNPISTVFITKCETVTHNDLPYIEDFNSYIPAEDAPISPCWKVRTQNNISRCYPDSSCNHSGTAGNSLYVFPGSVLMQGTCLVLPTMDYIDDVSLSFWMRHYYYSTPMASVVVGVMSDHSDTAVFTPLETCIYTEASNTWQRFEVSFMSYPAAATAQDIAIYIYGDAVNIDDVCVAPAISCSKPVDLDISNIGTTSATLTFNDNTGANRYRVKIGNDSTEINDAIYQITGLDTATEYTVCVASICDNGNVTDYACIDFHTTVCDSGTLTNIGNTNEISSYSRFFPVYNYYRYSLSQIIIDADEIGGPMDISAITLTVHGNTPVTMCSNVQIYFQTTDVSTFDTASSVVMLNDSAELVYNGSLNAVSGVNHYLLDGIYRYSGNGNLMVTVVRNQGQYTETRSYFETIGTGAEENRKTLYVGRDAPPFDPANIQNTVGASATNSRPEMQLIACLGSCQRPRHLQAINIGYVDATITWNGDAAGYIVNYKADSETDWSADSTVNGNSYSISDLTPGRAYTFRVRALCDAGDLSGNALLHFTTIPVECNTPDSLQVIAVDSVSASVSWNPTEAEGYEIDFGPVNHTPGQGERDTVYDATSYTISGLEPGTTYSVYIRSLCGYNVNSDWSAVVRFTTTTVECPVPENPRVDDVDTTSVTIGWDATYANTYELDYGHRSHIPGQGQRVSVGNVTSYTISSLEPGTSYAAYVRSLCSSESSSEWSSAVYFTTEEHIGIANIAEYEVRLVPNPASSNTAVVISGISGTISVNIVDLNGREVLSYTLHCDNECIKNVDISELPQGAYFVCVKGESDKIVRKLIVK